MYPLILGVGNLASSRGGMQSLLTTLLYSPSGSDVFFTRRSEERWKPHRELLRGEADHEHVRKDLHSVYHRRDNHQHSTAQHSTAQHSTARHGPARSLLVGVCVQQE